VLAGGPQRTTRRRTYPFLLEQRRGILVHKGVLARYKGAKRYLYRKFGVHSLHFLCSSVATPVYLVHSGTTYVHRVLPTPFGTQGEWYSQATITLDSVCSICDPSNSVDTLRGGPPFPTTLTRVQRWVHRKPDRSLSARADNNVISVSEHHIKEA